MTRENFMADQKLIPDGVEKCSAESHHFPKIIHCDGSSDGTECQRCGKRWWDSCNFDEDCS